VVIMLGLAMRDPLDKRERGRAGRSCAIRD
jgi:hypothetical protein